MATAINVIDRGTIRANIHNDAEDSEECYRYRGTSEETHNILGFTITKKKYGDLYLDFTPEWNKLYFLVYVEYQTGDSFGIDLGNAEWIALVENEIDAQAIATAIYKDNKNKNNYKNISLTLPISGKKIDFYPGAWKGYFERLESVEIKPITLVEN